MTQVSMIDLRIRGAHLELRYSCENRVALAGRGFFDTCVHRRL